MAFSSHETVAEKRTSLEVAPGDSLCMKGKVSLEFDLTFIPNYQVYFGYIVRLVNGTQNIDLIYDQKALLFRVTIGRNFSGLSFSLDSSHLFRQWNRIKFNIDRQSRKLTLTVDNKLIGAAAINLSGHCYRFLWGANDDQRYQTRDIPPMRLREISVYDDDRLQYHWSLNEIEGNTSTDDVHQQKALAKNAVWIRPRHQKWELVGSIGLKGNAVTAFDKKRERLIISGDDSIFTYDLQHLQNPLSAAGVGFVNVLNGSQAIYDTITGKLYNVFIDKKKVASYRPGDAQWDMSGDSTLTEYWHANKFISPYDTCLYVIGGYGQLKYKNLVQRYNLRTKQWDILKTNGDSFPPRYLAALGTNTRGDTAFIMGGYGSSSGDQMLDPGNYFDLFAFDVKTASFKRLLELDAGHGKFVFANSLVVDPRSRQYFGLVFANDSFNSKLQVLNGALDNPSYKLIGSTIPYSFYDLQSFADLYYAPEAGKLIAVTLYYSSMESRQKHTRVNIYSIDFPPGAFEAAPSLRTPVDPRGYITPAIILVALAAGGYIVLKKRSAKKHSQPAAVPHMDVVPLPAPVIALSSPPETSLILPEEEIVPVSKIKLFGQFQVIGKDGADISDLFTPVIRELFLLIIIYTYRNERGITSDELNEILWMGKPVKDAKNNRSVNMAKLKNLLEKVGNCILAKKSGFWQFQVLENSIYVDFEQYMQLVRHKQKPDRAYIQDLLKIVGAGSFLFQAEFDWLDDIKAEISNTVIGICLKYISSQHDITEDPEFFIDIANCIFFYDRLNEDALEYKCKSLIHLKRHVLANNTYVRFLKDYKDIYGEDFGKSFNQVIKSDPTGPALPIL